jgi:hypothetical protein
VARAVPGQAAPIRRAIAANALTVRLDEAIDVFDFGAISHNTVGLIRVSVVSCRMLPLVRVVPAARHEGARTLSHSLHGPQ